MQLTEKQRQLVEDNHNMIYDFIHKHHLHADVYYDILAIELCKAAMDYDESTGNTFSTIAYFYFLNSVRLQIKYNNTKSRCIKGIDILYLDREIGDEEDKMHDIILDSSMTPEEVIMDSALANDIYTCCTGKHDKTIIDLIILGYEPIEIAYYIGVSRQRVHTIIKDIRRRYNERREKYVV